MLYEIHDPANYITPDVVVDFTGVKLDEVGPDRVRITGGRGQPRPEQLKVSVGIKEGWIGEAELTYAGLGCLDRARLAEQVVRERLKIGGVKLEELRVDYIGLNSLHGDASLPARARPYEVRLRFAGAREDKRDAVKLGNEVETLVGKGPCASSLPRTARARGARDLLGADSALGGRLARRASRRSPDEDVLSARDRARARRRQGRHEQHRRDRLRARVLPDHARAGDRDRVASALSRSRRADRSRATSCRTCMPSTSCSSGRSAAA